MALRRKSDGASGPVRTVIHDRVEAARRGENPAVITRLASGWAVMGDTQYLAGYCLLLPDPVVPSLNDMDDAGRAQYLADMARMGDAVMAVCRPTPRRINYEMLGNLEPALHAHVFPRYEHERDAMRTKPVWLYGDEMWKSAEHAFDPRKHAKLQRALAKALEATPAAAGPGAGAGADGARLWQQACTYAAGAHRHQLRKDDKTPYIAHPFRVAMTMRDIFGETDQEALAAAVLHDTIEDTTTDYENLSERFGEVVADTVAAVSKDMRLREDVREREYDEQLGRAGWRARLIKLCDVYDNMAETIVSPAGPTIEEQADRCRRAIALARRDTSGRPSIARAIEAVEGLLRHPKVSGKRPKTRR